MTSRVIAIIGRPNVGKSTLFNRMIGSRTAIVEDRPGVTRDRNYARGMVNGRPFLFVDTGGFDPEPDDGFLKEMKEQVLLAMEEADLLIALFDAKDGLTPSDRSMAEMLRGVKKPVLWVVNKVDEDRQEPLVPEFYALGMEEIFAVSATHARGLDCLRDAIERHFPVTAEDAGPSTVALDTTTVAVVGRPNVGKSTLINKLLGENRLLTSDIPGTTRDAIDTWLELPDGRKYVFVDTAGLRRKSRISDRVERFSVMRALASIERAQVALIVLDSSKELADQDARIISAVTDQGKAVGIIANKWDLVEKGNKTTRYYEKDLAERLPNIAHAPILFLSALSGQRVSKVVDLVDRLKRSWTMRVPTGEVNRFLLDMVQHYPPPFGHGGHRVRFLFATQAGTAPPLFVLYCSHPEAIPESYKRYILNRIREKWGFEGAPIRFFFRDRKKADRKKDPSLPRDVGDAEIDDLPDLPDFILED